MSTFTSELSLSYLDFATPLQPQLIGTYVSTRSAGIATEGGYTSTFIGEQVAGEQGIGEPPVKGRYVTTDNAETVDASAPTRGTYIS